MEEASISVENEPVFGSLLWSSHDPYGQTLPGDLCIDSVLHTHRKSSDSLVASFCLLLYLIFLTF